ncbi:MAG: hypothetical protein ACRED5_02970 [Propylenella sp.]
MHEAAPVTLPVDARDEQILDVVRLWCERLAAEEYDAAFRMTSQKSPKMTPDLLKRLIEGYGWIETELGKPVYKVTSITEAPGLARHEVVRYQETSSSTPNYMGYVWFDLPLNGRWSDLTVTFNILRRGANLFLELDTIHVM